MIKLPIGKLRSAMKKIEDFANLAKLVKEERKRQKITQMQLAGAAGVGIRFIVDLEKGKKTCQIGKVFRILNMLGIQLMVRD